MNPSQRDLTAVSPNPARAHLRNVNAHMLRFQLSIAGGPVDRDGIVRASGSDWAIKTVVSMEAWPSASIWLLLMALSRFQKLGEWGLLASGKLEPTT